MEKPYGRRKVRDRRGVSDGRYHAIFLIPLTVKVAGVGWYQQRRLSFTPKGYFGPRTCAHQP
jgi:hypothetical protein